MGFADHYLGKQKEFSPYLSDTPSEKLRFAVVIPSYCEPGITGTLESLWNCHRPSGHTEVIVVVNSSENDDPEVIDCNKQSIGVMNQWVACHDDPALRFALIETLKMPVRDAGVGLARKTGMDEAIYRFNLISRPDGYLLSLDADSLCDPNYFTAIEDSLISHPETEGFDIYFEHPVAGIEFPEKTYQGIINYELHLRYVNQFLRYSGFPFAHHTVGSCFGVRADIYAGQGGMNKRKAGEDFYFLHKIIPLGHFIDINTTRVVPSPRESSRVPFGTGTAIAGYMNSGNHEMLTYAPECFQPLQQYLQRVPGLFKIKPPELIAILRSLPSPMAEFLEENNASEAIMEINRNSRTPDSFRNRFFRWFDAFKIIKYLNYASRHHYIKVPVSMAVRYLLKIRGSGGPFLDHPAADLLGMMRRIERANH
jgi:hypothetical protein